MSTITDLLAAYVAAELAILGGQSYQVGDRTLTRANLAEVRRERAILERRVTAESSGSTPVGPRHRLSSFSGGSE
jgi:hypothetical protein